MYLGTNISKHNHNSVNIWSSRLHQQYFFRLWITKTPKLFFLLLYSVSHAYSIPYMPRRYSSPTSMMTYFSPFEKVLIIPPQEKKYELPKDPKALNLWFHLTESCGHHIYILHEWLVCTRNDLKYNSSCDPQNTDLREAEGVFYIL